jgi:DNA methylase
VSAPLGTKSSSAAPRFSLRLQSAPPAFRSAQQLTHYQKRHTNPSLPRIPFNLFLPHSEFEQGSLLANVQIAATRAQNVDRYGELERQIRLLKPRAPLFAIGIDGEPRYQIDCCREVLDGLLRIGFLYPQQIIWDKGRVVLTRTHYWYQHEPCWYVRKKNAPWFGKADENSTIWAAPSPKFIMGGLEEDKFDHPTQKPVDLMRRPILNHIKRGGLVYDPFLGSGTTLAAAEVTGRLCCGLELDPKYVDVIVTRWQSLTGQKATLDGNGLTFDKVAQERGSRISI